MLNISYQDFSEVHSYLLSMNAFFDSAISHMNSALSSVPSDISGAIISKYSEIIEVLSNCYSSIIPSISGAFDDFIYRMSKVDDYFAMYGSSNAMGDLTNLYNEFLENADYDDGESLAAFAESVDEYFNRLVSMGITDGNMTYVQEGIDRFKESGDVKEIEWVYNYMFEKYNDIYLNGLYNYYWDSDKDDSILFGDQSIKDLYAETNAYLSESQTFEGDNAYDYWKWKYGIDIDQRRLDNEYARYKELKNKLDDREDLTDEEIEEYEKLQNEYDERYKEIYNLQSELYDSLDKNFLEDFLKMVFWDVPLSVAGSFASGALHVVENIVDGAVVLTTGTYYLIVPDNPEVQAKIMDFVGTNWTEEGYFELMELCGVDSDIASQAYQVGAPIGTMGGYLFLGTITGGAGLLIDLGVSALAGAGDAAETAYKNGATFDQGYWSSVIAGGLSIGAEFGLGKISNIPSSPELYKKLLSEVGGAAVAASEPFLSSLSQYFLYSSNQVDENGNLMYTDFWDYMDKTDSWSAVLMAGAVGAGRVHGGQANAAADVNATPEVKSAADVNATPEVKSAADVNATPEVKSATDANTATDAPLYFETVETKKKDLLDNAIRRGASAQDVNTINECLDVIIEDTTIKVSKELQTAEANRLYKGAEANYRATNGLNNDMPLPSDVSNKLWDDCMEKAKSYIDPKDVDDVVVDRLKDIDSKLDYSLDNSHAYKDAVTYYEDTATGSNGALEPEYINNRESSYTNGAKDGYVRLNSTYSNNNFDKFGTASDGKSLVNAASGMEVGESVPVSLNSIGRPKQTQYVSSASQYNSVSDVLAQSTKNNVPETQYGARYVDKIGQVNGLPTDEATLIAELQFERPASELDFSHNYSAGANSQAQSAGLPVRQLPDGSLISMYEGLVPSVNLNGADLSNLDMVVTFKDINTGDVLQVCEFYTEDGVQYMRRIS